MKARSGDTVRTLGERRRRESGGRAALFARLTRRWHWKTVLAVLLALVVVEGQPVAASYATAGQIGPGGLVSRTGALPRSATAQTARTDASAVAAAARPDGAVTAVAARELAAPGVEARPDFAVTFSRLDHAQAGQPFSYTLQVRNDGGAGGAVSVSTILPPELSNVRVTAPGFVCTRRFSASGAQAGTLVACNRGDLESGGSADIVIEAHASAALGPIRLTASADPRDEVAEADETNNDADATLQVHV